MTVSTTQAFLDLLEKSGLLSSEQLAEARGAGAGTADPRALARLLLQKEWLTRWQASQLLAGRWQFSLGKYKLLDLLGRGGMGSVFVAQHTTMNRRVALKIISKELGRDRASLDRFLVEARAVAAVDHPNIVHAYNVDNEGDRYYIVMEYVEGQDLQRMVEAQGPLEFENAVEYIRQAAEGLAHAHGRKMVHCDIKPANLIVNQQGAVKILDMGMARLVGREEPAAQDERVLGTVDYLAPEQAMGSASADHRVDIYSLGCTLYFLLTGQPPFPEGTLAERIVKHQAQEPRSLTELRPGVPRDLVKICQKMMAKNPDQRFQTAEEIAQVLAQWRPPKQKLLRAVPLEEAAAEASPAPVPIPLKSENAGASGSMRAVTRRPKGLAAMDRRQLILLGAIGGGAVLVVLAVVIFLLASGGDGGGGQRTGGVERPPAPAKPPEVESIPAAKKPAPEDPDAFRIDMKPPDPNFDPTKVPEVNAEEVTAPGAAPAVKPDNVAPEPERKPEPKAEAKPAPEAKPETKPEPKESKPEPKPEVKPEPKPEAKAEPKPQPKAEAKPQPPKPAPPRPKDPLAQFPKAIDLPILGKDGGREPFELGKVFTAPDDDWQVWLHGGDAALKSPRNMTREFVLQEKDTDAARLSWMAVIEEKSGQDAKKSDVAKIWRDGDALRFQWAEGADPASANYLRNCLLEVRAQGKSVFLQLVTPKTVEPLVVDFTKAMSSQPAPVEYLPDPARLRVEVSVEGFGNFKPELAEPGILKDPVKLNFPRRDRDGNVNDNLEFVIDFTAKRQGLTAEARVVQAQEKAGPAGARRPRGKKSKESPLDAMTAQLEQAREHKKSLENKLKDKNFRGEQRSGVLEELRMADKMIWYGEFFTAVQEKGKIHFSVYLEANEQKIVFVTTKP